MIVQMWVVPLAIFLTPIFVGRTEAQNLQQVLEERYFSQLDGWIAAGGSPDTLQHEVVEPCGKLVLLLAQPEEVQSLMSSKRSEFDFRTDACAKLTVHRLQKQPEFEGIKGKNLLVKICRSRITVLTKVCQRSKLP